MSTVTERVRLGRRSAPLILACALAGLASAARGQVITEFPVPFESTVAGTFPERIAAGPDGNLWFTEDQTNHIGRMTTAGALTEFPVPTTNRRYRRRTPTRTLRSTAI